MLGARFVLYPGAACLALNLAALACAGEKEPRWVPLAWEKAAITAPPKVLKRAFPNGIGGGFLAVNPRTGDLYIEGHACLKSTDGGRTWAVQGVAPPSPIRSEVWTGLLPGRDENHFVFLSKKGPMETLDGGKAWSLVARMPEDFAKTHLGISLGYDAAHDIFYLIAGGHGGLRPVKYARQGVPQGRAEAPAAGEEGK